MLKLSHIAKRFGEKRVLQDVTFSVPEHTVFGFVGQNGAGKTTAMKLILGFFASDCGEISVNGMRFAMGIRKQTVLSDTCRMSRSSIRI